MNNSIPIQELSHVDIRNVNMDELVDVSEVKFDNTVPQERRAELILQKVKNPYCFRVGDMGVKVEFAEGSPPLQSIFTDFLTRKKSGL
jgi:hypothetical protein